MNRLKELSTTGSGYRTYLIAAIMVVLSGLKAQGYIDDQMYQTMVTILASIGLATLRASIGTTTRKK